MGARQRQGPAAASGPFVLRQVSQAPKGRLRISDAVCRVARLCLQVGQADQQVVWATLTIVGEKGGEVRGGGNRAKEGGGGYRGKEEITNEPNPSAGPRMERAVQNTAQGRQLRLGRPSDPFSRRAQPQASPAAATTTHKKHKNNYRRIESPQLRSTRTSRRRRGWPGMLGRGRRARINTPPRPGRSGPAAHSPPRCGRGRTNVQWRAGPRPNSIARPPAA